jgi:hypothetical protein
MLGEQIAELKDEVMSQRVLNAQGPTMETTVSASGSVKGTQVRETLTFKARPTSVGVLNGVGQAIIMAGESGMVSYTDEGIGRLTPPSGGIKWRREIFYTTSSTGKLAFLNNVVGLFEAETGAEGSFSEKISQW